MTLSASWALSSAAKDNQCQVVRKKKAGTAVDQSDIGPQRSSQPESKFQSPTAVLCLSTCATKLERRAEMNEHSLIRPAVGSRVNTLMDWWIGDVGRCRRHAGTLSKGTSTLKSSGSAFCLLRGGIKSVRLELHVRVCGGPIKDRLFETQTEESGDAEKRILSRAKGEEGTLFVALYRRAALRLDRHDVDNERCVLQDGVRIGAERSSWSRTP